MVVVEDELVEVVEVAQVVHHHLVHTALQLVEQVVNQIVHMKVDMVELPVVETSMYLVVEEKCHTVQTEKVDQVQVSGINQVVHITMPITKKRLLMVSGDLEEVMVTIHKTVLHMATAMAVQAVLSSTIIHNHESITN